MFLKRYVWSGAAAIAAPLLTGCGTALAEPEVPEPSISVRTISNSEQVAMPLVRYLMPEDDQSDYFNAVNVAQKKCAAKFDVKSSLPVSVQPTEAYLRSVRRYGLINQEEASRRGYELPPLAESKTEWAPSAREAEVMQGRTADGRRSTIRSIDDEQVPVGGCARQGLRDVLQGDQDPVVSGLVDNLLKRSWELTISDSRAQGAGRAWSKCMAGHGYRFEHRWDAGNSVAGKPSEVRKAMAQLDLECAVTTNYNGVLYAIDSAYQELLIEENRTPLEDVLDNERRVITRARHVLGGTR